MSTEYLNNKYLEKLIAKFQKSKADKAKYETILGIFDKIPDGQAKDPKGEGLIDLAQCQKEYKKIEEEFYELQDLLGVAFFTLSDNLARYTKFNYIDIDDAVQDGVMICFEKLDRFNPAFGKSFNYFTTVVINCLRQQYRTARNYNELKRKYHDYLQTKVEQSLLTALKNSKFAKVNKNFNHFENL